VPTQDPYYAQTGDSVIQTADTNSTAMINNAAMWATGNLETANGDEFVNVADSMTPLVTVTPTSTHQFSKKYPWDGSTFMIESPGPTASPPGDGHAMVVNPICHEFEAYGTWWDGTELHAYSGADWTLHSGPFTPLSGGIPSALSSGTSMYLGLAQYSDITNAFYHTLNMTLAHGAMCKYYYTAPADDTALRGNQLTNCLPWGAKLYLKLGTGTNEFDQTQCHGNGLQLAEDMAQAGVIAADDNYSGDIQLYLDNGPWNNTSLACLHTINIQDFFVQQLGTVTHV